MRLPTTLKALKFVIQGKSFGRARQIVKDRRFAKALQAQVRAPDPVGVAAQIAADGMLAARMASDGHDPHLMMQDHLMAMAHATVQLRAANSPAEAASWKRARAGAAEDAYREWSHHSILADRAQDAPEPMRPARLKPMPTALEEALAAHTAAKLAERQRDMAVVQRSTGIYGPGYGGLFRPLARAYPSPRTVSFVTLPTPALSMSRRSSVSSDNSFASTPSEATSFSFWRPDAMQPKLVRSGSDPEVGGFRPMHQRKDSTEV